MSFNWYHIKFKVIESMFFRAPGEFSPATRETTTVTTSMALPLPSTTAGCLAYLFVKKWE